MPTVPNFQAGLGTIRGIVIVAAMTMAATAALPRPAAAGTPVVPGRGYAVDKVGDDFESGASWEYAPNYPKSSRNIDKKERGPLARSSNGRWLEGPHRGTPDLVKRVATPAEGLVGSQHSLLIRTLNPGIPGKPTRKPQQDDLMVVVDQRLGGPVPVSVAPSCVVRVYVPPFDQWENRSGSSFGFRTDCWGTKPGKQELEQYWPGIFFNFRSETDRGVPSDSAFLMVRGDAAGRDVRGPEVTPGWWTLGMSVSSDGQCHFYAKPGTADLTDDDRLASYFCYGYRAQRMDLFFFNVVTMDNGQQWSTPWIIDDPTFYTATPLSEVKLAPVARNPMPSRGIFGRSRR